MSRRTVFRRGLSILKEFDLKGTEVTASGAELNILDNATSTYTELNYLADVTAGTPAASKALVVDAGTSLYTMGFDGVTSVAGTANFTGAVQFAGTAMTSSAAELNYLDGATAGTPVASKALVVDAGTSLHTIFFDGETTIAGTANMTGVVQLAGTAVSSTAAELNYLDGSGPGTAVASKAAVLGANKNLDEFHTAALYIGADAGTQVTATAAELNLLDTSTAGVAVASKAVALGASKDLNEITVTGTATVSGILTSSGTADFTGGFQLAGTAMTSTAAELNYLASAVAGTATASKAVVLDASSQVDTLTFSGAAIKFGANTLMFATAVPTGGTYETGDVVFNSGVAAGGTAGWSCTTGGTTGGTWKAWGTIEA